MSHENVIERVENDTQDPLTVVYTDVDVTDYTAIKLHIKYKTNVLSIDADVTDADAGEFEFPWASRVETTLDGAVEAEATTIEIDVADYASMPASGEIQLDGADDDLRENVLYSSKTGPNILNLASGLVYAHADGATVEKLPDLRTGTWPAEIELYDDTGKNKTFNKLTLKVDAEIA